MIRPESPDAIGGKRALEIAMACKRKRRNCSQECQESYTLLKVGREVLIHVCKD